MSIFSKKKAPATLGSAAVGLVNALKRNELNISAGVDGMLSMEGLDDHSRSQLDTAMDDLQVDLKSQLDVLGLSTETLTDEQLEAAAIVMAGARNPGKYHQMATDLNFSAEGANLIASDMGGSHGVVDSIFDEGGRMSMEAFENKDLTIVQSYSAMWNIGATRQDSGSEMLYPTHVLTPDQVAVDVKVPRTLLFKGSPRTFNGDPADFGFKNALEAYRDHTLLENETTEVIPNVLDDGSNAKYFVDPALCAPKARPMAGNPKIIFKEAPLRIGAKFDLLSLSSNPAILDGQYDNTDQLHSKIVLREVDVLITDKTSGKKSLVPFKCDNYTRAIFTKTVEGDFMEMQLTFSTEDFGISEVTADIAGTPAEALASLKGHGVTVRLAVEMSGKSNLQTGLTHVYAAPVTIAGAFDSAGPVATDTGALADLLDNLTFAVDGYRLQAFRTNSNLRTEGLLVDRNWKTDRFAIPLGAPLSVVVPLGDDGDAQAMNDLINITNIRNSNVALTRALNYGESLAAYCKANKDVVDGQRQSLSIEGIARYLVTPHYAEIDLDVEKELQSLNSQDRVGDVNAVMINTIRTMAYDALVKSNYLPALRQFTQGSDEKPRLVILTDLNLPQYLMVEGDPRTVSIGMDFEIQSSPDLRLKDTILMTFSRKNRSGIDYMSFGTHIWIPELVSVGQVAYRGANVKRLMVQPRNSYIHQLPIFMRINVQNLQKAIAQVNPFKVENTVVTP